MVYNKHITVESVLVEWYTSIRELREKMKLLRVYSVSNNPYENLRISSFNEILSNQYIYEVIKYWMLLMCKFLSHIRSVHSRINMDLICNAFTLLSASFPWLIYLCHKWHRWRKYSLQLSNIPTLFWKVYFITDIISKK